MPMIRWQSVCSCCGKAGGTRLFPQDTRPFNNPSPIGGKCPSSSDGKHRPKWVKV